MAEKIKASVVTAFIQDGELNILLSAMESDQTGILLFRTKSWDDEAKELVDDDAVKKETDEQLEELFGLTFDDIVANPLVLTGQEVEAYWDEAYEKFRLTEPVAFTRYDVISEKNIDAINDFVDEISKKNPVVSLPLEEHYGVRIKVGIEIPEVGKFRISKLSNGKQVGKINYATKKLNTMKDTLKNSDDPQTKDAIQQVYDANVKSAKAACINKLDTTFGMDFEKLLNIGGVVRFKKINVQNFQSQDGIIYYLEGVLDDDQDIALNEELEEKYNETIEE